LPLEYSKKQSKSEAPPPQIRPLFKAKNIQNLSGMPREIPRT